MNPTRFFICHNLNLAEEGQLEVQLFHQLCQRLRDIEGEAIAYTGSASEEEFLAFFYKELPTCHWLLIFQTPAMAQSPAMHVAVDIARMRVAQKQLQGILRFVVQPGEIPELVPEWSTFPSFGATSDYPRALEKLLLALTFSNESTEQATLIAPPPPPTFPPIQGKPQSGNFSYEDLYSTSYSSPGKKMPWQRIRNPISSAQPDWQTSSYDALADRPSAPPSRLARFKAAFPAAPRMLLVALCLGVLLVAVVGAFTPLRALIAGRPTGLHPVVGVPGSLSPTSSTPQASSQVTPPPRTVQPITVPTQAPKHTPTAMPTPTANPTPTPVPTARPTPTPTPKPCPPTLLYGGTGEYGSSGTWVKTLQSKLNSLGVTDSNGHALDVDGEYGPLTESAVKKYQTQQHITVDGVTGPETWHHLGYC